MSHPPNPVAAVTHPDPYPYYARLAVGQPVCHDPAIGAWVVASADAVTAVLTNGDCRVRPVSEPVPEALLGSPAGDIFGRLVRMRDGEQHQPIKDAIAATLATLDHNEVSARSRDWARTLVEADRASDIMHSLSTHVIGSLLGIPSDQLDQTVVWMNSFARCFSPISTPEQIEHGKQAAQQLWTLVAGLLADRAGESHSLLDTLAGELQRAGCQDDAIVVANGIGLLWQAYDATAGLIGNTLVALARQDGLRHRLDSDPTLLDRVILEVLRHDPPIQNTRRYLAADTLIAGHRLQAGDSVLVALAAANRDPAANPNPKLFDPDRTNRQSFTFGAGPHACPGRMPAVAIAREGVAALLEAGVLPDEPVSYQPSVNARIPIVNRNRSDQP